MLAARYECYFKAVRFDDCARVKKFTMTDRATLKACTELRHFRVFLEGHGCHQFFAKSFSAGPDSGRRDKAVWDQRRASGSVRQARGRVMFPSSRVWPDSA